MITNYYYIDGQVEEVDGEGSPSPESTPGPSPISVTESDTLKIVGPEYYTLYPIEEECEILKFVENIKDLSYKSGLGYGFYQFTKPELISYDKQVILMGKVYMQCTCTVAIMKACCIIILYLLIMHSLTFQNNKLYYGPDARQVINCQSYDESKEVDPPNFEYTTWKCAFIQTRSNVRVLQPNTYFLYCKYHQRVCTLP